MNNRWAAKTDNSSGSGSQVLALAMFIMLLAFFIVLNAISTFDETQAEPVLQSLENTFAPRVHQQDIATSVSEDPAQASGEGTSLQRISSMFNARIPSAITMRESDGALQMRVEFKEFKNAVGALPSITEYDDDRHKAYRDIFVAVLAAEQSEHPLRMDVIIYTAQNPADGARGLKNLKRDQVKKISEIAAILESQGMPIHLFSFAFQKGPTHAADLIFHSYQPYDIHNDGGL